MDDYIRFYCEKCNKRSKAMHGDAGRIAVCQCGHRMTIPNVTDSSAKEGPADVGSSPAPLPLPLPTPIVARPVSPKLASEPSEKAPESKEAKPINERLRENRKSILYIGIPVAIVMGGGVLFASCIVMSCYGWLDWLNPFSASVISSHNNEKANTEAVCFIVKGYVLTNESNGKKLEFAVSTGTGFAVTTDGYIFSNEHVVEESPKDIAELATLRRQGINSKLTYWVFVDKKKYVAELKHSSAQYDFAILKIDHRFKHIFALAKDCNVPRGTKVHAMGYPAAAGFELSDTDKFIQNTKAQSKSPNVEDRFQDRDFVYTQTAGSVNRFMSSNDKVDWIQHDTTIHPGNSGGPLVLEDGRVVAINTRRNPQANNVSMSFAVSQLKAELEKQKIYVRWK